MNELYRAACCPTKELFFAGNGQGIRELLLQAACKYCTSYSTDMVYWIERATRVLYDEGATETYCYFRDNGIAWERENFCDCFKAYKLVKGLGGDLVLYDVTKPIMHNGIEKAIENLRKITEESDDISAFDKSRLFSNIEYIETKILKTLRS